MKERAKLISAFYYRTGSVALREIIHGFVVEVFAGNELFDYYFTTFVEAQNFFSKIVNNHLTDI